LAQVPNTLLGDPPPRPAQRRKRIEATFQASAHQPDPAPRTQ